MRGFIEEIGNYRIYKTDTGGKAGKGLNKTSSIFVTERNGTMFLDVKSFRYKIDGFDINRAINLAKTHIKKLIENEKSNLIQGKESD